MKLIYDGDCGFCTKSAKFGKKRLRNDKVEVVAWQSIEDLSVYGLTQQDVQTRVYFVNKKVKALGGVEALGNFGLHMRMLWPIPAALLLFPPIRLLAEPIYVRVARNRHKLPGATDACRIEFKDE